MVQVIIHAGDSVIEITEHGDEPQSVDSYTATVALTAGDDPMVLLAQAVERAQAAWLPGSAVKS